MANICSDCPNGNHEGISCSCHGNPVCLFCGRVMENDIEQLHIECIEPYNDSVELSKQARAEQPFGRYPWER